MKSKKRQVRRRAKPPKTKAKAKRPVAGKALQKRLEDALKREAEAQEQQAATSEILRVISSSPADVQPVFDAIIDSALRLCDATFGGVFRFHDGQLHVAALSHVSQDETDAYHRQYPRPPHRNFIMGRAFLDGRPVHVEDVLADPDYDPGMRKWAKGRAGYRTVLAVPILRDGAPIGVVGCARREVKPFTPAQIELVKTFADQAVIAIENVRLFNETKEALERQTATSEILRVISSSPTDVQPVLDAVAEHSARICGAMFTSVYQFDGELIHMGAHHNYPPAALARSRQFFPTRPNRQLFSARAILERAVIHVPDVERDEHVAQDFLREVGFRSVLSVPMLRDGNPIGAITVWRREVGPFTDAQIELLKTFADQAVIAVENVRLFSELEGRNRDLTATSEILRVISQSPTDAQPVFDVIVRSAAHLCNGLNAAAFLYDGELIHNVALSDASPEATEEIARHFPQRPNPEFAVGRVVLTGAITHSADVVNDPSFGEGARRTLRLRGIHALLAAPMLRDGRVVGAISVGRAEPGLFTDTQVQLLQTFADQAVIAVENVRLFTELQASNRELTTALDKQTATSDILRVISGSQTDAQPVFDAIVASAVRLLGGYSGGLTRVVGDQRELAAFMSADPAAAATLSATYPRPLNSGGAHGQAIRDRAPVNILDIHTDLRVTEAGRNAARIAGYRSVVTVPLLRHDEAIGAIGVTRREAGGFTDDEIALLQTFADQAVIAVENVRLFKELQASNMELTSALETQTATSDILRVISQSQTNVQPVFDAILASAVRLLRAHTGVLTRVSGDQIELAAFTRTDAAGDASLRAIFPQPLHSEAPHAQVVRNRAPLNIADAHTDLRVLDNVHVSARARGYRSWVTVPLLRHGEAVGTIAVTRREPGAFTDEEITLLKTFADQAVIAIENVRLFTELQARTGELTQSVEKLTALGEVSRALSSTLDVETVLDTIVSRASQLAGAAGCSIYEYDEAAEQFELRATHNDDAEFVAALRAAPLRKGEGLMGRAAEMHEPIQIPDITQPGAYQSSVRDTLIRFGYRALLAVPLLREDQIIGSLSFNRKAPGEFPTEVVDVLKTFATQSALAIQNARLFREIADKSAQLEAASRHKSEFLANMSHELRTPLNAIIGFSEVLVDRMFGELNEKQDEYLKDIFASGQHLLSLINDILDLSKIEAGRMELEAADFDLPSAIDNALTLVRERASRRGIALGHSVDERLGQIRGDERKVKQVLLNLLSNALKFTPEGGRIDVSARLHDGVAEVSVADTGVGIAPEDQEAVFEEFRQVGAADKKVEGTGLGLALSRKFIELHGGRIWVKSAVSAGSTFTFTLPLLR